MRVFIVCFVAIAVTSGAPTPSEIVSKSVINRAMPYHPVAPIPPIATGSAAQHATSFDNGAHQASSVSGQGSGAYDHGSQASKVSGSKESSGSKENYAYSANNAFSQGSGQFQHSGSANHLANLASGINHHFQGGLGGAPLLGVAPLPPAAPGLAQSVVPGVLPGYQGLSLHGFPGGVFSSVAGGLQKGSLATGHAQGQGAWSYNHGQSSVNASGNKETFANKESFGQEHAAGHAVGAGQHSHKQNSQAGHHNKGQEVTSTNHGAKLLG